MTRLLTLVAVLFATLVAPAHAWDNAWPQAGRILVPPARYDPWIKPYAGRLVVKMVDRDQVYEVCDPRGTNSRIGPRVLACAKPRVGYCTIILPRGMPRELYRAVRRHEVAHCRGWDHSNLRRGGDAASD